MLTLGNSRLLAGSAAAVTLVTLSAGPALAGPLGQATARVRGAARHDGRAAGLRASAQASVPAVGLVKSASIQSYSAAGTPITYTAWTFSNGNLGFSNNNTGTIYEISVTSPSNPTFQLVSSSAGPVAAQNNNDGASCLGQDTDLSIVKTGPVTVPAGGAITWALTITDNGPGNSSGFAVHDPVPAAVTDVTTSTPGCTVTGHDVQCAEGNLGEGDSFVITVSGTAPATAGTCVVNKATITANETEFGTDDGYWWVQAAA